MSGCWFAYALASSYWTNANVVSLLYLAETALGGFLQVSMFAMFMGLCWPPVAATQFTTFMALLNVSNGLGAIVADKFETSFTMSRAHVALGCMQIVLVAIVLAINPDETRQKLGEAEIVISPGPQPEAFPPSPERNMTRSDLAAPVGDSPSNSSWSDATELARQLRERDVSADEVVCASIVRIERLNPAVNAVVTTTFDLALEAAERADKLASAGNWLGPLHGVPILIKDLYDFRAGIRNTFGCPAMVDFVPDQTVAYIDRLEGAGAIILGKTNTPEFGHKGTTDNRLFGPTRCPFDLSRNAGGSSGGSAAAVAVGMVPLAQGSDAGGSIRIPAAWCGVVGFKPSYGRVPNTRRRTRFSPTRRSFTPGRWHERSATRRLWRRSCPGRMPTTRSACPRMA